MTTWLRVNLSRIGDDIRRGENLEIYVTMLVATFVLIASIAGYDRFTVPAVMAVLLLITYGQLSYKKLHEKQQQDLEDIHKAITQPDSDIGAETKPNNKPDGPPLPLRRHDEDSSSVTQIAHMLGWGFEQIELVSKESTASHDRYTVRLLKKTSSSTFFSYDDEPQDPQYKEGDVFVAVVHRLTRALVSVTQVVPDSSVNAAPPPPDMEPSIGFAYVLSILFGGVRCIWLFNFVTWWRWRTQCTAPKPWRLYRAW